MPNLRFRPVSPPAGRFYQSLLEGTATEDWSGIPVSKWKVRPSAFGPLEEGWVRFGSGHLPSGAIRALRNEWNGTSADAVSD